MADGHNLPRPLPARLKSKSCLCKTVIARLRCIQIIVTIRLSAAAAAVRLSKPARHEIYTSTNADDLSSAARTVIHIFHAQHTKRQVASHAERINIIKHRVEH